MWLLPSLRRPASLARFFAAYRTTGGSTPGVVIVDVEDYRDNRAAYDDVERSIPAGWHVHVTKGVTQGDKVREIWDQVMSCSWLGLIGDDCVPETVGWDRRLVAGLDRNLIVSCDDAWQAPRRVANCWVVSGDLVRSVGYLFPPGLHHLFVDDVWETIGREGACWHCDMSVRVAHRSVLRGDGPIDDTHRAAYGDGFLDGNGPDRRNGLWAGDELAFSRWRTRENVRCVSAAVGLRPKRNVDGRPLLAICTPVHDCKPDISYVRSLLLTQQLLTERRIDHVILLTAGQSHVGKAREHSLWTAIDAGATHILFIDSDMGWEASLVTTLLEADLDFCCAVGAKKQDVPEVCCNFFPGVQRFEERTGFLEVKDVGFAFTMIRRSVVDRLCEAHPELKFVETNPNGAKVERYALFFDMIDFPDRLSEDFAFCRRWAELGGRVYVDHTVALVHVGRKEYSARPSDFFEISELRAAE